jgi:hypothetical protein
LIQQSCTPILIKTVKSYCSDNSSTGLFAFGVDLTNGDYSVEVVGQGCNNWQNCTGISITGQGTAPFQCSIYGTSCP